MRARIGTRLKTLIDPEIVHPMPQRLEQAIERLTIVQIALVEEPQPAKLGHRCLTGAVSRDAARQTCARSAMNVAMALEARRDQPGTD